MSKKISPELVADIQESLKQLSTQSPLSCPKCDSPNIVNSVLRGKKNVLFARIHCSHCSETAFFQVDASDFSDDDNQWGQSTLEALQMEWSEWVGLKKRHLYQRPPSSSHRTNFIIFSVMLCIIIFLLADRYYMFGEFGQGSIMYQDTINDYVKRLRKLPCFSAAMKEVMRTVPVYYTSERVYSNHIIQYGEAGVYMGKEMIKIHQSNFWFLGWPKTTRLIETLVHEFIHREHPSWHHNESFYKQLDRDLRCALKHW